MEGPSQSSQRFRFGPFEVDLRADRLRKGGQKITLQQQPFQVLVALLEHPGELVPREELVRRLWPTGVFVDFDHSLNKAVNKLREALGDSSEEPRYIETLSRRGYRFIAPVENVVQGSPRNDRVRKPADTADSSAWLGTVCQKTALIAGVVILALLVVLFASNVRGWRERLLQLHTTGRIQSLAVLPLDNLSYDPEQEYFVDGMTEELINSLAHISALKVISRTSVMQYKGARKPLPEIAKALNVDVVVEGTVLRSGNRVRITAQLIQANTDTHLWADSYERDLGDVLALQDEVARDIASEIKVKLTSQEQARLTNALPVNPEAHELYLKGRYYWNKRTPDGLEKGLEYFQQAIEKDSSYALAYAGLADSYLMLGSGAYAVLPPSQAFPKAEAAATKALQLDSTLAEAHTSLAWSKYVFDWDWQGAEREYKRAIELNPGYANAYHWYAAYLSVMGRHTEAIAADRKAESLDPLSLIISSDLGDEALAPAGLYDQAIEQCRKTLEMDPNFAQAHACLADSFTYKGMYKEAFVEIQRAIDLSGGNLVYVSVLGYIDAVDGRTDEATKILNEMREQAKYGFVPASGFVLVYAGLGDKDQAFSWAQRAYANHEDIFSSLVIDPRFHKFQSDPRFQGLMRRVGLPP